MTLTFPLTSAGPGPTSAALKFCIFSAEIAIPLRLMLIPVFHPGTNHGDMSTFSKPGEQHEVLAILAIAVLV